MFSIRSLGFSLPSFLSGASTASGIPSIEVHEIEEAPEKRARTVKHLIRANHINHSIIHHNLESHNYAPHILSSAYLLGANPDQLHAIYDQESDSLEPWKDAPTEISRHDWRDYLGKREYQRAWIDFFEDQLVQQGYDWRALLDEFFFRGKNPLINNLIAGLGHPLVHLGYAYQFSSPTLAIESLALVASFYNPQHIFLDDPSYTSPSPWSSDDPLDILQRMHKDPRFDSLSAFTTLGASENYDALLAPPSTASTNPNEAQHLLLEYWNALTIHSLSSQLELAQRAAVALLLASSHPNRDDKYDFFLVHTLTSSHALRILLPLVDKKHHVSLLRQWWLLTLTTYMAQLRPAIDISKIQNVHLNGRGWKHVRHQALNGEWKFDAHFVNACRALEVAKDTWGDKDDLYFTKAAVKFAHDFTGWAGAASNKANDIA